MGIPLVDLRFVVKDKVLPDHKRCLGLESYFRKQCQPCLCGGHQIHSVFGISLHYCCTVVQFWYGCIIIYLTRNLHVGVYLLYGLYHVWMYVCI